MRIPRRRLWCFGQSRFRCCWWRPRNLPRQDLNNGRPLHLNSMTKSCMTMLPPIRTTLRCNRLRDFPNDSALLVHREADGPPEWHETQADIFFVQSGAATLLVGGTLLNGETVSPHEKRNGTIQGGVRRKLAAGDVVRIPPHVPHQVLLEGSHEFNYFVIKIKGY